MSNTAVINATIMTPQERYDLYKCAFDSTENGSFNGYNWTIFDKITKPKDPPEDCQLATKLASSVIFSNASYAKMYLGVYEQLCSKIRMYYTSEEVMVVIKGSSATALYFINSDHINDHFPFSDLDIVVYINPNIEQFERVHNHISIMAGQVFAKHKQQLDRTFFRTTGNTQGAFPIDKDSFIAQFSELFDEHDMMSPFESDKIRNICSAKSYSIIESNLKDKVIKIEEPHFTNAERIPLYKTPVLCSDNKSIVNNVEDRNINFELIRMKWGAIGKRGGAILFDCVDCIVPFKDDYELQMFEKKGGFNNKVTTKIQRFDMELEIPNLVECKNELWNMIHVYDCPESKKEARIKKLEIIEEFINNSS